MRRGAQRTLRAALRWRTRNMAAPWSIMFLALVLVLLAACASTVPSTDADAVCHREPEHDGTCPAGTQAYSCFTGSACVFPGEPGEHPWVCCP